MKRLLGVLLLVLCVAGFAVAQQVGASFYNLNNNQIYVFSADGSQYSVWEGENRTWRSPLPTSRFADGNGPFSSVGAAFYNSNNRQIYLFNTEGTQYTTWDGATRQWRAPASTASFADGNGPFSAISAVYFNSNNGQIYLFDAGGRNFTVWNPAGRTWRPVAATSQFANGQGPFNEIEAIFYHQGNNEIYVWNEDGTRYTAWNSGERQWRPVEVTGSFADGRIPIGGSSAGAAPPRPAASALPRFAGRASGSLADSDSSDPIRGGVQDIYLIDLRAGEAITLDLSSSQFDTYLTLREAAGIWQIDNDDGGPGLNSRISVRAPSSGTYQILVRSFSSGARGEYTLVRN